MKQLIKLQRENVPSIGLLGKLTEDDLQRIVERVDTTEPIECWLWSGAVKNKLKGQQHGLIKFNGRNVLVHRLMYHNFVDDVPPHTYNTTCQIVLHKCGHHHNGRCINPLHLKLGTFKENTRDALSEGSMRVPSTQKFDDNLIESLKEDKAKGMSWKKLENKYKISSSTISRRLRSL